MWVLAVLALLLLGAALGGAGVRRLAGWAGQAAGRWRPGAGLGAVLAAFVGLALAARGVILPGVALVAVAVVLGVGARKRGAPPTVASGMSEAEARSILGVGAGAGAGEIKAAYTRLMQRVHPDKGGAVGLAAQLNAARDRLLG